MKSALQSNVGSLRAETWEGANKASVLDGSLFYAAPLISFNIPGDVDDGGMRGPTLRRAAREGSATVYLTFHDVGEKDPMRGCVTGLVAASPTFTLASRNPFGAALPTYRAYLHRLDVRAATCDAGP